MSVTMQVRESETGLVRLFAVTLPEQQALALKETPDALPQLLGVPALTDGQWELFDLADLAGLGLEGYLADGHGISEADLAPHLWALDALEGVVLILRSAAVPDRPATLTPRAPLRWVATFGEEKTPVPLHADLPSASAQGALSSPPASGRGPRGSLIVLVLGLLLTGCIALALYLLTQGST